MTRTRIALAALMMAFLLGSAHGNVPTSATAPASQPTTAATPFEGEIRAFEVADRSATPPPRDAVVFYGSSSFRMWSTLAADLPGLVVVNRGFGGSRVTDCLRYLDRALVPLRPRMVVIYAGDNDLAQGATPDRLLADTLELFARISAALPEARIVYVSIKPSPARAHLLAQVIQVNRRIDELVHKATAAGRLMRFVDVATPMLGADGQPRAELFGPDQLHMNASGYALWTKILGPVLMSSR